MQILPLILTQDKLSFEEYGKFFEDYSSVDHKQTTFSKILDDINLPDYDSKNENLREFSEAYLTCSNSNISRLAVDQIIQESKKDIEEKSIPVKYFLIDFRSMILGNRVRFLLKD